MSLATDSIIDRLKLKKSIVMWRALAVLFAVLSLLFAFGDTSSLSNNAFSKPKTGTVNYPYIARISIDGIIFEDNDRDAIIRSIAEDKNAKAVILHINSPGGTIVGGENLYYAIRDINKPVVAVMGSLAASGGYMTAIAADHIFARAGTITGSIGVLMQSFDVTSLADKVGVGFNAFKSGNLKSSPSPFEKISPDAKTALSESIEDSFDTFLTMVVDRRPITSADIGAIKDGRIFTGKQALKVHLVDELGGEKEALNWLRIKKNISSNIKVVDIDLSPKKDFIDRIMSETRASSSNLTSLISGGSGIMAIWKP